MMDNIAEPPRRSGGIDFDQSDVQAEDLIGRDKFEFNLPEIPRKGCYAQLSKNIKFVVSLGVILFLIYAVFQQLNRPSVSEQTPTPTAVETATPTTTPEPITTPTVDDQQSLLQTMTAAAPSGRGTPVVDAETGTPIVEVTATSMAALIGSPTPTKTLRSVRVTATQSAVPSSTPVVRPPTPTSRPTPTPLPPTPSPAPPPRPTPRPATPNPCLSASVRLGPVAQLATQGDVFTISVLISCAVDLAGYQVELRFDPAIVVVRDASNGGLLASAGGSVFVAGPEVDNSAGIATIGAIVLRPGPYPSGSGTLASFSFEAMSSGSTDLDADVSLSDVNGQAIPVGVTGAAVVVQAEATTVPNSP